MNRREFLTVTASWLLASIGLGIATTRNNESTEYHGGETVAPETRGMTNMRFKYLGDSTGSPLTNGEQYEIIHSPFMGVDYIEAQPVEQPDKTIKLTRTEWQTYDELDLIER